MDLRSLACCFVIAAFLFRMLLLPVAARAVEPAGELLYNGIQLPKPWPPKRDTLTREPMEVPYLKDRPAVIPIDVGRQLFIDDFLIENTTLHRTFHSAEFAKESPVLRPDKTWEMTGVNPTAMVFSDGVWFDPKDKLFKMWYMGGYTAGTCYATSTDGIKWDKPALDAVKAGTNIVQSLRRDSATVWLDHEEKDPAKRYKMFVVAGGWQINLFFSPDGIHWGDAVAKTVAIGDRSTVFYNPFRKVWVYSIRSDSPIGRARRYWESPDVLEGAKYSKTDPPLWVGADKLDPMRDDLKTPTQLYNLDAAPYESVMLGFFTIWRGQPRDRAKPNEVLIGWSRDGYHWDRPNRTPFIPVSEKKGDYNWGNVQSAGGGCLVVGDKLYFYFSARKGIPDSQQSGESTTGLATLRRDGFASMDTAEGPNVDGTLTTRPIRFGGKHLFVNASLGAGELRVEALDEAGVVIPGFSAEQSVPLSGDKTRLPVLWTGSNDCAALAGKPVRLRFHLKSKTTTASLYSFWMSEAKSGASHGYVGAGGPGFDGPTDTTGS